METYLDLVQMCDEKLGKKCRWTDPRTGTVTEGEVDTWSIQKSITTTAAPFLQIRGEYRMHPFSEYDFI